METILSGGLPSLCVYVSWPFLHVSVVVERRSPNFYRHSRLRKGRVDRVDGQGIVGIRRVAADVDSHAEPPTLTGRFDLLVRDERRDGRAEVYAIDEDVRIQDLLEWSSPGRLSHVPLQDVGAAFARFHQMKTGRPSKRRQKRTLRRRPCGRDLPLPVRTVLGPRLR